MGMSERAHHACLVLWRLASAGHSGTAGRARIQPLNCCFDTTRPPVDLRHYDGPVLLHCFGAGHVVHCQVAAAVHQAAGLPAGVGGSGGQRQAWLQGTRAGAKPRPAMGRQRTIHATPSDDGQSCLRSPRHVVHRCTQSTRLRHKQLAAGRQHVLAQAGRRSRRDVVVHEARVSCPAAGGVGPAGAVQHGGVAAEGAPGRVAVRWQLLASGAVPLLQAPWLLPLWLLRRLLPFQLPSPPLLLRPCTIRRCLLLPHPPCADTPRLLLQQAPLLHCPSPGPLVPLAQRPPLDLWHRLAAISIAAAAAACAVKPQLLRPLVSPLPCLRPDHPACCCALAQPCAHACCPAACCSGCHGICSRLCCQRGGHVIHD